MSTSDLTPKEQEHVRTALRFLHRRVGTWAPLSKALRVGDTTLSSIVGGRAVSASIAFRIARFAKVAVDDVLTGKFPAVGACPMCGQVAEKEAER